MNIVAGADNAAGQIRSLVPKSVMLDTHVVSRSARQLSSVRMALRDDEPWFLDKLGVRLVMTESDLTTNQVAVYVSDLTPDISRAIEQRFLSGAVRLETSQGGADDACTRTNCGPPWTGGVKIWNSTTGNGCTLGFVVRLGTSGTYGAWTAGHCHNGAFRQGSAAGALIGSTVPGSNHSVNGSNADVQVVAITAANKTNKFINDTATCSACNVTALTGATVQQGFNADEPGDSVCNNGAYTGRTCGVIASTDLDNFEYPAGIHLYNQRRATYVRQNGDSGGPVYTSIGLDAVGSHVHYRQFPERTIRSIPTCSRCRS